MSGADRKSLCRVFTYFPHSSVWLPENLLSADQQLNFFIAHILQPPHQMLHISVFTLGELIMDGKDTALFQNSQCFQNNFLPVSAGNVVIAVVAGYRIEMLVRKIQLARISLNKGSPFAYALGFGIVLAK